MAEAQRPDEARDVIVQHVRTRNGDGSLIDRWLIHVGHTKHGEMEQEHGALVFARLLADVHKRPVWIHHDDTGFTPADLSSLRGCSCCS
jgi:hypothetical protein